MRFFSALLLTALAACGESPAGHLLDPRGANRAEPSDVPPSLAITSPVDFSVYRDGLVPIIASCGNNDGSRNCFLEVRSGAATISGTGDINRISAVTTTSSANTNLSTVLSFRATDPQARSTVVERTVMHFAPGSDAFTWLYDAPGQVMDYDGQNVIYGVLPNRVPTTGYPCCLDVSVRSLATGLTTSIVTVPVNARVPGWLRGNKAIIWGSIAGFEAPLYFWNGTTVTTKPDVLGIEVAGGFALYRDDSGWTHRNLTTDVETAILGPDDRDPRIGPNGDVVYWRTVAPHGVFRWRNGVVTQLSTYHGDRLPLTDGINVVFQRPLGVLALIDGFGNYQELSGPRFDAKFPDVDYMLNGGWVAFTRYSDAKILQLWRRAPDGTIRQLTSDIRRAGIEAIGEEGSVVARGGTFGTARFLIQLNQKVTFMNGDGSVVWRGGQYLLRYGRAAFTIIP